ncbi:hypothetical protein HHI36_009862 [Cryptolaemus montrouzieri]|uniref:Uncharacterized protein n=1 Tax=Cryptolaemus montrouzieri TaxID=559131 RepID=A0ABD2MH40_9CUCU
MVHYTRNAEEEYRETLTCRDESGELINENTEIFKRWGNHFKTALEGKDILEGTVEDINTTLQDEELEAPFIDEFKKAINKLNLDYRKNAH